jgi:N-acetyl-anhydromuramyl-L-alanine amidase AmpD
MTEGNFLRAQITSLMALLNRCKRYNIPIKMALAIQMCTDTQNDPGVLFQKTEDIG